jgi:Bifunctional DNA primase/polymerase, N-terminal/Primase C terminal 1 (PriCT-1)
VTGAPDRRPRERAAAAVVVDGPERQARSSVRSWSPRKVELGNVLEPGTVPSMMNQASHDYLERGWSIIPIRPEDKRPLIRWEEFQHRHPTEAEVQGWFSEWPTAGVGIVTGSISGLVVIDIDVRHGGDVALAHLEQEHGHLPATLECCTGGGGCHLYFAHPGGLIRNKVGLAPGIDLRGDGGYVVAPPSLHASGRRYAWVESRDPRSRAVASPPDWVLRQAVEDPGRRGHPIAYWRRLVRDGVAAGERNNTIASLAGHLLRHGLDAKVAMGLLLCWNRVRCRPPLVDEEVASVVTSIRRLHERDANAWDHAQ